MEGDQLGRRRRILLAAALAVAAIGLASGSAPARPAPRWVLHAERFPGGLSGGVRARALFPAVGTAPFPAAPVPAPPGPGLDNVKMNTDSRHPLPQNETAAAYDLFDPMKAVAASNDWVSGGLWIGHTSDGGRTWTSRFQAPKLSQSQEPCNGSDPSVVFSRRDRAFYVSTLCYLDSSDKSEVDVWKSVDDGAHWTASGRAAVAASNLRPDGTPRKSVFYDKELLAVDNTPASPFYGRLYATYIKFHMRPDGRSDYCPLQVAYTDHVPTPNPSRSRWRHTAVLPNAPGAGGTGPSANQWATPLVDLEGGLDVAYVTEDCDTGTDRALFFKRSTDGGRTFSARVRIDHPGQFVDNPDPDNTLPGKLAPLAISPSLAFDPTDGSLNYVFQNNVNRATSGADISYTRSDDLGAHWSGARVISITATGASAPEDQFFPWIAADGAGKLIAIWFDNRNDPNGRMIETYQAVSSDGGTTWTNSRISSVPWDPNRSFFSCGCFIGDYIGLAASPTVVYPVWTDGRNTPGPPYGDTDIYTNVEIGH